MWVQVAWINEPLGVETQSVNPSDNAYTIQDCFEPDSF